MEYEMKEECIRSIFYTMAEDLHKNLMKPQIE
jgi:hypothetical protein